MMDLFGGLGGILIIAYLVLFAAIVGAMYWLKRYLRQLTRVQQVKGKLLMEEFKSRSQSNNQSSSETT